MSRDEFLLIKAWSYILCADIDHVLGQLLIAELTDRIPVVYWPTHCLHNGFVQTNGFDLYFEPISNYTIFDVANNEYTYYPPLWDSDNLLVDDQTKDTWTYRNIGEMLSSKANVIVGDVYYNVYELIPFIKKSHPSYGMTVQQVYRYLFSKYIKVRPDIEKEIQGYYNSWIRDNHPTLAVHIRRVDKAAIFDTRDAEQYENQYWNKFYRKYKKKSKVKREKNYRIFRKVKYKEPNKLYHKEISTYVDKYNIKKIFLLTDCEDTLKEYQELYGSKLIFTDCKRIKSDEEVSNMENSMIKRRRGIEIIKDVYIAAKCDFFIGNDFSNLSHMVTRIKDWSDKSVKLLYWLYKKRKYPVNARLIVKNDNIFSRIINKIKKAINKYWKTSYNGGDNDAK